MTYLDEALASKGADGRTLEEHISDLLALIYTERPENPFENFEKLSQRIKDGISVSEVVEDVLPELSDESKAAIDVILKMWPKKGDPQLDEDGEPIEEEEEDEGDTEALFEAMDNVIETMRNFNLIGAGLPPRETMAIALSLKKMAMMRPGLLNLSLWGKVETRVGHYYVAQATYEEGEGEAEPVAEDEEEEEEPEEPENDDLDEVDEDEAEEEDPEFDPSNPESKFYCPSGPKPRRLERDRGLLARSMRLSKPEEYQTGSNKHVYYVTSSPSDRWVRLPNVLPQQIVASRYITWRLTGDLTTPLDSSIWNVRFPQGKTFTEGFGEDAEEVEVMGTNPALAVPCEAAYLRCQIARIYHATTVAPRGLYTSTVGDEDDWDEEEDGPMPPRKCTSEEFDGDMTLGENGLDDWVHITPIMSAWGRVEKLELGPDDEEEELPEEEEEEEEEEFDEDDEDAPRPDPRQIRAKALGKALSRFVEPEIPYKRTSDEWEQPRPAETEYVPGSLFVDPVDRPLPSAHPRVNGKLPALTQIPAKMPQKVGYLAPILNDSAPSSAGVAAAARIDAWKQVSLNELPSDGGRVCMVESGRWPGARSVFWDNGRKLGFFYEGDALPYHPVEVLPVAPLPFLCVPMDTPEEEEEVTKQQEQEVEELKAERKRQREEALRAAEEEEEEDY